MAWTQAVQWLQTVLKAPNSPLSRGQSQKCQFYVGLSLMKQLKIIKSWPSNTQLLFCVMKWEVHTIGSHLCVCIQSAVMLLWWSIWRNSGFAQMEKERGFLMAFSLLYMEEWWLSQGKVLVQLLQLWVELPAFFMDHQADLKVPLTDALWWVSLVDLADISLYMNTVSLWLQGKHLEESVASYKIWTFKWTLEFVDSFPILKDFSNEISSDFFFFF